MKNSITLALIGTMAISLSAFAFDSSGITGKHQGEQSREQITCDNALFGTCFDDTWATFYSTDGNGDLSWRCYDNFYGVTAPITDVTVYGARLGLVMDSWWENCMDDPYIFVEISFYEDNNGLPGVRTYESIQAIEPQFITSIQGFNAYQFNMTLDTPLSMDSGWFSIVGIDGDDCWVMWQPSLCADQTAIQENTDGEMTVLPNDLAFCLYGDGGTTDIEIPEAMTLGQNYPNPFNPTTTISYSMTEATHVNISVYDVSGNKVATLIDGNASVGNHTVEFDASNLTSGLYFYTMTVGNLVETRKMALVK